ncbi:MAG: RecQ family ATP-dependent DNA helicase [Saprospiraceae bacterium]|nr:RecQ family ATP-dependent DNA helicase [Saprospiraceae bacterium]
MPNNVLYLDIETSQKGKVLDIGALLDRQEFHGREVGKLKELIIESQYICGHNIIAHDIPILKKSISSNHFDGKIYIDTLLWSPILFSNNPYHKLVKAYKIVNESEYNNPLSDCKLTQQLLLDELNAFESLDSSFQQIIAVLLTSSESYSGFFKLLNFKILSINVNVEIRNLLDGKICHYVQLESFIEDYPVELVYAISLINTSEDNSILPQWVNNEFPKTQEIIHALRFHSCTKPDCHYCTSYLNPQKALFTYFGYNEFRSFDDNETISLQEKTVRAGLSPRSFVAVFPTGGGKSLTFQLPALIKGASTRQLTVVISPLVSLMKDQVENLEERFGITKSAAINGLLSPLERQEAIERVERGDIQLLYISPESLRSRTILRILNNRSIARFVIDEAHCFSSWGQDFRVDYLYIADFILTLEENMLTGRIPVSCFTATAKPQVIEDIKNYFQKKLGLQLEEYVTRASRTNLHYEVIDIENLEDKKPTLLSLLHKCEMPTIIYASRTKKVEELQTSLTRAGYESTYFHGKLEKEEKKQNMNDFMQGHKDLIVATSAFGMGVDKDDVKTVIHYNISDSLENYVQEAGRAGRNEKIQAKCYVLYNENDLNKHFSLLRQTQINLKEVQQIWQGIKNLSKFRLKQKISKSALEIAKYAGWDTELRELDTRVRMSISALENKGFLKRTQNSVSVFADSLLVPNIAKAIQIINNSNQLSENQRTQCIRVLQRIVKDEVCRIDFLAEILGLNLLDIREVIEHLREHKILGDARDLTAFLNLVKSKNNSKQTLQRYLKLEKALANQIPKDIKISLRQLNQNLIDAGVELSTIDAILNVLNYWEIRNFIKKKRIDRENNVYHIRVKSAEIIAQDIFWRHELCIDIYQLLVQFQKEREEESQNHDRKSLPVRFSMLELKQSNILMGTVKEKDLKRYEKALLYLNKIKSIQLEGGFMVFYNRLNIEDINRTKKVFTKSDFEDIENHYQHKTEQIHIVGEYAKRRLQNYESALLFVNDYFSLEYKEFLSKYFPRRIGEIRKPLTPSRLKKIIGELDTDQSRIVNDGQSKNILVLAGPGSGKTKVLVHKIASLLLLEDIKPEQFLMLTFSKAASLEFKSRALQLVPEYAGFIKITTFHGFCFQLLGVLGNLEKSANVITQCIEAIQSEEIEIDSIENKSVLLLDEFQDVNLEEWKLVQTIIQKAGNIRVIAVGDDDQNIYKFRGSSNEYMQEFATSLNATRYTLVKNYRSNATIVKFNNQWLKRIPNRLKTDMLEAVRTGSKNKIQIVRYSSSFLEKPLVDRIIEDDYQGTRVVLVRTNDEALMMNTLLKDAGQKTKLVTGMEGFSLGHLYELRTFTEYLSLHKNDSGLILDKIWNNAKRHFHKIHEKSVHYNLCKKTILKFEGAFSKQKLLMEWFEYIREIKVEDIINADRNVIIISTMHKSKGKEFDHVYLLLDNYNAQSTESKRLFYVACSRAKVNLQIHANVSYFDHMDEMLVEYEENKATTRPPNYFEIILGHKDINLASQKYPSTKRNINLLKSSDALQLGGVQFEANTALGLDNLGGKNVLLFSKKFIDGKYEKYLKKYYHLISAKVEYLVYWYDKEDDKEYKIVLPRVRFEKMRTITKE